MLIPVTPLDPSPEESELILRYRTHLREHGPVPPEPEIELEASEYDRLLDGVRPTWRFMKTRLEDRVHFYFHGTIWLRGTDQP